MGVAFNIVGQSIVDNMRQIVYIQAPRSYICGHQKLNVVIAKLLHGEITLLLTEITVQCFGIVSITYQLVSNFLCFKLCTTKDNCKDARIKVDQSFQSRVFIFCIHQIIDMIHLLGTLVTTSNDNFLMIIQIISGNLFNLATHRCRKKQRITVSWNTLKDCIDTLGKAHVEHLIGLIEHHIIYLVELGNTTFHQVNKTSRRGNNYLCALAQLTYLHLDRCSTVHSSNM